MENVKRRWTKPQVEVEMFEANEYVSACIEVSIQCQYPGDGSTNGMEKFDIAHEKGLIDFKPIKEIQGHRPSEVAIGCLLGFFIGLAFSVLK